MTKTTANVLAYAAFSLLFFCFLLASHWPVLSLPYFWDELGQFVPAALDILTEGAWIPKSTLPNVHPPAVMAWLAAVWTVTGPTVEATRIAMLALAAFGASAVFVLAVEVCKGLPGTPAFIAPLLLLCSPLFWAQSMMAQLDMPAMAFTAVALVLFLRNRMVLCTAACVVLVLTKETSIVVPFVFGCVLLRERRVREALLFFAPAIALAGWLFALRSATGHIFGNQEFTHYNVTFQLHPVRLPATILRRIFYLFVDNYHLIGSAAIFFALRKTSLFATRSWRIVLYVAALQTTVVSVLGGAALERYLMPVIPLFYVAVAAALAVVGTKVRLLCCLTMSVGLLSSIVINSPFTYPYENNAAFVSFVRLQQRAASYVESELPGRTIVSAWPFPDALRRPEFGYVRQPLSVRGISNFDVSTLQAAEPRPEVLVLYSRTWEPQWGALRSQWVTDFLTRYYFYQPQITSEQVEDILGLHPVVRWEENGQWIEVFTAPRSVR